MTILKGNPVSAGLAYGKVYIYKAFSCDVFETYFDAGHEEKYLGVYKDAVKAADAELCSIVDTMQAKNDDKAKIFIAHREILADEDMNDEVSSAILDDRAMPDYAVERVFREFAEMLAKAKDPLIAARAADIRDVRNRLLRILHGEQEKNLSRLKEKVIVVAHDLLPSDTATLDRQNVIGIVTEVGGATSHSAIIARSYKIPAVLGVAEATSVMKDGQMAVLDATDGTIRLDPNDQAVAEYSVKLKKFEEDSRITEEYLWRDLETADGVKLDIGINVGSQKPDQAYSQCDFVGLFRTEFLYMQNDHVPSEDEQYDAYKKVLENAKGRPVTLRTLDIGGDKTLKYLDMPKEDNPFLGNRALRLCLAHPEMFNTQLRAALRASTAGELWIMFPMVGTVDDIVNGKAAVARAKRELDAEGIPYDQNVKIGIMIEIPAIAEIADVAAGMVDFASVGTNDLCQYLHAVDRMNASITDYYQSFSPAMFRMLNHIFTEFNKAGKPVSVCGELAGNPLAAVPLIGLGLKKLSMSSSNLARVKRAVSCVTMTRAREIGAVVKSLHTEKEVKEYLVKVSEECQGSK